MRTHNAGVAGSNPACAAVRDTLGEEGNGDPPYQSLLPYPVYGFYYVQNRACDAVLEIVTVFILSQKLGFHVKKLGSNILAEIRREKLKDTRVRRFPKPPKEIL